MKRISFKLTLEEKEIKDLRDTLIQKQQEIDDELGEARKAQHHAKMNMLRSYFASLQNVLDQTRLEE